MEHTQKKIKKDIILRTFTDPQDCVIWQLIWQRKISSGCKMAYGATNQKPNDICEFMIKKKSKRCLIFF